jgi:4-hydroxybutyrate CoA-transferase
MRIGFRFCGGCNPKYDRGYLLRLIQNDLDAITMEYAKEDIHYDLMIFINGCERSCQENRSLNADQYMNITKQDDFNIIKEEVRKILKHKNSL